MTDDELVPVEAADVGIKDLDRSTATAADGSFTLSRVPVGLWTLSASHDGFEETTYALNVSDGPPAAVHLRLVRLPSVEPYSTQTIFEGKYECTWEFLIIGGDCFGLYENLTGQPDPLTDDTYAFRLPVGPGWESVVLDMTWQAEANNQFDGMRLLLEHGNSTVTGHGTKIARADDDANPLSLTLHRGHVHPGADYYRGTTTKARLGDEGEETQIRVYARGKATETTGQVCPEPGRCFLGVGVGIDVRFTVYATVFYHSKAPAGFSAVPT